MTISRRFSSKTAELKMKQKKRSISVVSALVTRAKGTVLDPSRKQGNFGVRTLMLCRLIKIIENIG